MSSQPRPAFASARSHACGLPCSITCGSTPASPKPRKRPRGSSPSSDAFRSRGDQHRRGAVDDLARVPGGHLAAVDERGLERRHPLERRVAAHRLVGVEDDADVRVRELDRDDLAREAALVDRARGALVRLQRVARRAPRARGPSARRSPRPRSPAARSPSARARPRTSSRCSSPSGRATSISTPPETTRSSWPDQTAAAALKFVCIEEPHWRSVVAPQTVSGQPAASAALRRDVPRLLVDLRHAAELDVLDLGRVEVVPRDEAVQHLRREVVARGCAASVPLRRPIGLRTASTISASDSQRGTGRV